MKHDRNDEADAPKIRTLPSCLGWGGVAISSDGTQRGMEDVEVLPVVIPLWAAMPEHDEQTLQLCTEFARSFRSSGAAGRPRSAGHHRGAAAVGNWHGAAVVGYTVIVARTILPLAPTPLALALDDHCARLSSCRRCTHAAGVVPIVSQARAPRAMLVGQAPGQTEIGGGKPFAGRAGRTLFRWLETAGLDETTAREWLYISAITRCYPGPHPSGRGDRVPTPRERERCGGWLDDELRIIRPTLLVPVGRLAIDRFLGAHPLAELIGRTHEVTHAAGRSIVIPLPHPSGASSWIHAPGNRTLLDRALALLGEHLRDAERRSVA